MVDWKPNTKVQLSIKTRTAKNEVDLDGNGWGDDVHSLGVDPSGNLVTGESQGYRVQKFIYKGLSTTAR